MQIAKQGLYLDTLDAQRLQKIRELETVEIKEEVEKEVIHQKPVFLTPLNNLDHLKEGEHAHLECRVEPINDPNLKIEWYVYRYKKRHLKYIKRRKPKIIDNFDTMPNNSID